MKTTGKIFHRVVVQYRWDERWQVSHSIPYGYHMQRVVCVASDGKNTDSDVYQAVYEREVRDSNELRYLENSWHELIQDSNPHPGD